MRKPSFLSLIAGTSACGLLAQVCTEYDLTGLSKPHMRMMPLAMDAGRTTSGSQCVTVHHVGAHVFMLLSISRVK
eukprot:5297693-Amphidinium_carterae.2